MPPLAVQDNPFIIVGAGIFGLSLAYELAANRKYANVVVLDRHAPPVPDGSSVDVSRIIRADYADSFYGSLAVDAMKEWRNNPDWSSHFYDSGFLMLSSCRSHPYISQCRSQPVEVFEASEAEAKVRTLYPGVQAQLNGMTAVHNIQGGWADARAAVQGLAERCSQAGVSFLTGTAGTVASLIKKGSRVVGVETVTGNRLLADTVVLATGAWTNLVVPDFNLSLLATGQPVGFIQLTPEEAARLGSMPVMINFDTGVFCFPPTPGSHMLKLARHGFGFATRVQTAENHVVSSPNLGGDNSVSGYLPEDAETALRDGVKLFFPEFAHRAWARLRMCWYTDTPRGDFVVDYHPSIEGLFLATGGSGHAFKFAPVLGKHIADCLQDKAPLALRNKWRARLPDRNLTEYLEGDGSRGGPPMRVVTQQEQARL
ncbi:L-pipecolate oxidase [Metarhizium anisopliae BRIP 53293]|uniref:L-pipecolate oxidase n=1 Tax=Metarhizium anisopliae BRIP 53293 TaxID=1291518 RepID=A0A0D9NZ34_METAN|nr:L-pipecolate oxidase [Metarhizium anisopliae BRIP 53293]KJK88229.1 L-pipecolate oxidase [Metarhizium anisopliae BRIP 53284]